MTELFTREMSSSLRPHDSSKKIILTGPHARCPRETRSTPVSQGRFLYDQGRSPRVTPIGITRLSLSPRSSPAPIVRSTAAKLLLAPLLTCRLTAATGKQGIPRHDSVPQRTEQGSSHPSSAARKAQQACYVGWIDHINRSAIENLQCH
jgi:hypothetical protein